MSTRTFVHRVLIVLIIVALALAAWAVINVLLLVFGAVLVATLLRTLADPIARHARVPEGWGLAAAIVLVLAVLASGIWLAGAQVSAQLGQLAQAVPLAWHTLQQQVENQPWINALMQQLESIEASSMAGGLVQRVGGAFWSVTGGIAQVLIVFVAGVYLAIQPRLYRDGLVMLVPKEAREQARDTLNTMGNALRQWLLGQLIAMTMVGLLTGIGLWLLGMPSALALGLIAGLLEFVPLIGPWAAAVPAVLIAFTQGWTMVVYVGLLYIAVQQIESNLVMPIVQRRMVSLPPAVTLFAVVVLGLLFGVLGVLFATPLAVILMVGLKMLYVEDVLGDSTEVPGR